MESVGTPVTHFSPLGRAVVLGDPLNVWGTALCPYV